MLLNSFLFKTVYRHHLQSIMPQKIKFAYLTLEKSKLQLTENLSSKVNLNR